MRHWASGRSGTHAPFARTKSSAHSYTRRPRSLLHKRRRGRARPRCRRRGSNSCRDRRWGSRRSRLPRRKSPWRISYSECPRSRDHRCTRRRRRCRRTYHARSSCWTRRSRSARNCRGSRDNRQRRRCNLLRSSPRSTRRRRSRSSRRSSPAPGRSRWYSVRRARNSRRHGDSGQRSRAATPVYPTGQVGWGAGPLSRTHSSPSKMKPVSQSSHSLPA